MTQICTASTIDFAPTSIREKTIRHFSRSIGQETIKRLSSEMMASSRPKISPKPTKSPNIAISVVKTPEHKNAYLPTITSTVNVLFPGTEQRRESDADRYYTASSGDEDRYDDDYDEDDDDDDDGMCIMLESDDDDAETGSLSGLHINLKTLQAVSNMLAHYIPIIQRDISGNPLFVAPPPPPLSEYEAEVSASAEPTTSHESSISVLKSANLPRVSECSTLTSTGDEVSNDFQIALQELENVISAEEDTFLVDKMSELTDVMEKMTYYAGDEIDDI